MRTIKFRAFSLHGIGMYFPNSDSWFNLVKGEIELPKETILMQSTGLFDKNGKEIYEGDILNVTQRQDDYEIYATVEWDSEEARWSYLKHDGDDTEVGELYAIIDKRTEIIGNIYENPDLLTLPT